MMNQTTDQSVPTSYSPLATHQDASDIAISVRNVSKCYRVFDDQRSRLLHAVWPKHTKGTQEIWALKDINFEIKRGESVAIIGRNGGGKSTLLEIITKTLTPTTGEVKINGRVSALLELGSGFNPEYTGRDNVILNGLLLGLSREEIFGRFEEIEAFAEIGAAIDRPVKTYSSGMMMRLAFAVQVLCDPEILIVDEALSVGDFFFQQKCFARLRKMRDGGLTLLFVSHDMGTVRDICSKALYLAKGSKVFFGDSKEAIRAYLSEDTSPAMAEVLDSTEKPAPETAVALETQLENAMKAALWHRDKESLNNNHRLLAVVVRDMNGTPSTSIQMGSKLIIQVFFRTKPDEEGHITLIIKNKYDQIVSVTGSYLLGMESLHSNDDPYAQFDLEIDCMLEAGLYSIKVTFGNTTALNCGNLIDSSDWLGPLQIYWNYEAERAPFVGMFGLPVRGKFELAHKPNIFTQF